MKSHSFSFEGGEILNAMRASWFVFYAYYETIDSLTQKLDESFHGKRSYF